LLPTLCRLVLLQKRRPETNLDSSTHSVQSINSNISVISTSSFSSAKSHNSAVLDAVIGIVQSVKRKWQNDVSKRLYETVSLLKMEEVQRRHARALAFFRILTSPIGEFIVINEDIFQESLGFIRALMLDQSPIVKESACLTLGAFLGRSTDSMMIQLLKEVRRDILGCMRTNETVGIHIAMARGLAD
jgi:hypothetical protein